MDDLYDFFEVLMKHLNSDTSHNIYLNILNTLSIIILYSYIITFSNVENFNVDNCIKSFNKSYNNDDDNKKLEKKIKKKEGIKENKKEIYDNELKELEKIHLIN